MFFKKQVCFIVTQSMLLYSSFKYCWINLKTCQKELDFLFRYIFLWSFESCCCLRNSDKNYLYRPKEWGKIYLGMSIRDCSFLLPHFFSTTNYLQNGEKSSWGGSFSKWHFVHQDHRLIIAYFKSKVIL